MKKYLVVDTLTDYKKSMDYKELKNLLIDIVHNDLLMNCSDYDVSKNCSGILSKLAKEDFTTEDYIKEELSSYSYKIIDLLELQRDLEDAKDYFTKKESFNEIIEVINKGVNESE